MTTADNSPARSIQRVFALMEALSSKPEGEGLVRLAAETGLSKSTAHRLLGDLIQLGYAMQDRSSRKFYLTVKLFEVGSTVIQHMNILNIAKPFMFDLSRKLGELVNLGIRVQHDVLYIYIEEGGKNAVRVAAHMGARSPMFCTGIGKAIMAELPDADIAEVWKQTKIEAYTPTTITSFPALMESIQQVRQLGYALDLEEYEPGIWCVAASILNYSNVVQGGLSVSAPMSRMSESFKQEVAHEVATTCRQISAVFGKTEWTGARHP